MQRSFAVSQQEYPFTDHWFAYRNGNIHYVDEGKGTAVLLLHGNPTWSYLYRNIIKELRGSCRLIALDYAGFGMSKAPSDYQFTPQEQAEMLESFINKLGLKDIILVVQDWGGPIGMNYAVHHADNIRGIVVMNSWAWPASHIKMKLFSIAMGGWPLGYWLQTKKNFFAKSILPHGIYQKDKLTESLRKAYTDPFPTPSSRKPTWIFPRYIRKAKTWLAAIEAKLPLLSHIPTQILWGINDADGFPPEVMKKWQSYLKNHETLLLEDASHFVQEDRPDAVIEAINKVIERSRNS